MLRLFPALLITVLVGCRADTSLSGGDDVDRADDTESGAPEVGDEDSGFQDDDLEEEVPPNWWVPEGELSIGEEPEESTLNLRVAVHDDDGLRCVATLGLQTLGAPTLGDDPVYEWWTLSAPWPEEDPCPLPAGLPGGQTVTFAIGLGRSDARLSAAIEGEGGDAESALTSQYGLYVRWNGLESPLIFGLATPQAGEDGPAPLATAAPVPPGMYTLLPLFTLPLSP